ncbi:ABC transporter substrate-binding protein [Terasakiispira papahanaumokuakeensis]|nr:ABC transporter substrate-binding protein [Terasakiispira papahanaumokuakeensis]
MRLRRPLMALFSMALLCSVGFSAASVQARSLVLAIQGEPETGFDPIMGWGRYGHPLFQSTLLRFDPQMNLQGDLATSWVLSDDRLVWRITLRDDAVFSDGTPLTAEDVVFTFNTARDADGLADVKALKQARVVNDHTVELVLNKPRITFLNELVSLGIVPKATYGQGYARHPVGSGPFQMVEWREGAQLVVKPNPYWYGQSIPFERVTFVFGGEQTGLTLARTGQAQMVAVPPAQADQPPEGMHLLSVKSVDNRGIAFPVVPAEGQTTVSGAPIGNRVTADRAIRVAVNQGLDRDALVQLALNGHGRPALGPVDGLPWNNPQAHQVSYDPDAARKTLNAAGWVDQDGDGIRERDGVKARFKLYYAAADSTRQALALGAAQQLALIGIQVEPVGASWNEIKHYMHQSPVVMGWGALSAGEMRNLYSGATAGQGYFNTGFYQNAEVDQHMAQAEAAASYEDSLAQWQAAQWDGHTGFGVKGDAPWAWMVNLQHTYWVSDCLETGPLQIHPHGHGFPITHDLPSWRWTCEP